ncbi:Uncharacterised protein [uncultured archaeon]|nr:Uncharacterised protein [uncultured archaeon]
MIVIILLIILSVLAVGILLSPVTISVNSSRAGGKIDGFFSLSWIIFLFRYGLVEKQTEVLVFGRQLIRIPYKEKPLKINETRKSAEIKKSGKTHPIKNIISLSKPMLRLFKDLIYAFRLKYLDLDFKFGLKDPSDTGILTGFLHSILGSLQAEHKIQWTADFTKPLLEWNLKAMAAIRPIRILPPIARFVTNGQVLRSGLHIISGRS